MKKHGLVFAACALALLLSAAESQARALSVFPDTLKPEKPSHPASVQNAKWMIGNTTGGATRYTRRVTLPRDSVITKLEVLGVNLGAPAGIVSVMVFQPDEYCLSGDMCIAAQVALPALASGTLAWQVLTDDEINPGKRRIGRGDVVMIVVELNSQVAVGKIKLFYKP